MLPELRKIPFVSAGISFFAIGVLQLYSRQILIGRPAFSLPGEWSGVVLAWTIGALLILNGILVIKRRPSTVALVVTAAFIIFYCVMPNLWLVVHGDTGIALTNLGKGISLATGLLLLTHAAPPQTPTHRNKVIYTACNFALGFFLAASGVQHFLFAAFVVTLIPSWIPLPLMWTYATGGLLVLSGLCLITGLKRKMALHFSALMIFLWVLIIHIPRAFFTVQNINELTALSEALAFASILTILGGWEIVNEKAYSRVLQV